MIPRYRAFYKANQKMYEVLTLDIIDEKVLIENNDNPKSPLRGYVKITETELMQSTGLYDKNGVEIYEGDIITTDLERPYLIVEYRNGAFMINCNDGSDDYYDIFFGTSEEPEEVYKYGEVIGNIHDNP